MSKRMVDNFAQEFKSSRVVDSSRKHMCSSSHKSEDNLSRDKTTAVRRGSILCGVMRCGTCGNKMTRENTRETTRLPDGTERHMVTTGLLQQPLGYF